ncbi:MAG: hypothetical protein JWP91_1373 [Fibrobacteres bacterium]|nr:hypothetical protein [Fibrobacterota bacterium]
MSYSLVTSAIILGAALAAQGQPIQSTVDHVDQFRLLKLVKTGRSDSAFRAAQAAGDAFFAQQFLRTDGVGANVENGNLFLFTRVPRADLKGTGEWYNHFPARQDGPNGQSCVSCHNQPVEDGGGTTVSNINRDPFREAVLGHFIRRNAPHTMGMAGPQLLAEEMTAELRGIVDRAKESACRVSPGRTVSLRLIAKGVDFGIVSVTRRPGAGIVLSVDLDQRSGIDSDLVVKPFQWKGSTRFIREFNRGAAHTEMGMQAVEILHTPDEDGDFDGVINEFSVGDLTALAIYNASQPRPVTRLELADLGLETVSTTERKAILRGETQFKNVGCAVCHVPRLTVNRTLFREPSPNPEYRDVTFPAGRHPLATGLDPAFPVSFDITKDQPDNIIRDGQGRIVARLGSFRRDGRGGAIIELYSDLKRHNLGEPVAEPVDETASPIPTVPGAFQGGVGVSTFLTRALWGVGSTAPYMQDGNSTTLTEAIDRHEGEAANSKSAFNGLSEPSKADLIAFLNNLVLFKQEAEEEGPASEKPTFTQPNREQMRTMMH